MSRGVVARLRYRWDRLRGRPAVLVLNNKITNDGDSGFRLR